jgi:hypothetical protein
MARERLSQEIEERIAHSYAMRPGDSARRPGKLVSTVTGSDDGFM